MKKMVNQLIDICLNKPIQQKSPDESIGLLINYAKRHKIEGILKDYFDFLCINNKSLDLEICEITKYNEGYIKLAGEIAKKFEENNVEYAVLKGVALCREIYNKIYYRKYNDLDLLICFKDIPKVEKILGELGFVQGVYQKGKIRKATRQEIVFKKMYTHELFNFVKIHKGNIYNVDINFKFSWNGISNSLEYMVEIPCEKVLESTKRLDNFPANILNNEYQFLHLCCHLYNESMFSVLDTEYQENEPEDIFLNRIIDIIIFCKKEKINVNLLKYIMLKYKCNYKINFAIDLMTEIREIKEVEALYNPNLESRIDYWYDKKSNRLKRKSKFADSVFNLGKNI